MPFSKMPETRWLQQQLTAQERELNEKKKELERMHALTDPKPNIKPPDTDTIEEVQDMDTPGEVCLFVCGISLTSDQLVSELFPDWRRSCFSQVVLRCRGGDRIYEMRCLFVAVGSNARFIVLPHWDNMS